MMPIMTSYYDGVPILIHHSMVAPILREFAFRTNRDQYRMFTFNGYAIEDAEDNKVGIQGNGGCPETPLPINDWQQMVDDGELVVASHPETDLLIMPRVFFSIPAPAIDGWFDTPSPDDDGELFNQYTDAAISFKKLIDHMDTGARLELFFGVVKALRSLQVVIKSPVYYWTETEGEVAPRFMEEALDALPDESANRLTSERGCGDSNMFEYAVNVDLVADFLIAKRAFQGWRSKKASQLVRRVCPRLSL
jgi:hypothetical protein